MASLTVPVKVWILAANKAGTRAAPNTAQAMESANFRIDLIKINLIKSSLLVSKNARCQLDDSI